MNLLSKSIAMLSLSIAFSAVAAKAVPTSGHFQLGKVISKTIAPPEAQCDQFISTELVTTKTADGGYDVVPFFTFPWSEDVFEGQPYHCTMKGSNATCGTKSAMDMDLSGDGLDAVVTITDNTAEAHQWVSPTKFKEQENASISCRGNDCAVVFGAPKHCTMNIVVEYDLKTN